MFLTALRRRPDHVHDPAAFPWSVPVVRQLQSLELHAAVTLLVGENGCGKSTLLEGMAMGVAAVAAGSHDLARDPGLAAARSFAEGFVFVRRRHARTRLFMRAEDVFGFTTRVAADMAALDQDAGELAASLPEGYGRTIATAAVRGQRRALAASYGENPDGRSHGETFLALLGRRLVPQGLYFLDEPETPLSPTRILSLLAMIVAAVEQGSQFVIATHSPILMALPGADILQVEDGRLRSVEWNDTEHVRVTRAFLNDPRSVLEKLLMPPAI